MRSLALAGAVVVLSGCNQLLFVEGQVDSLCQHLPKQVFPRPITGANADGQVVLGHSFDFDVSVQLPSDLQAMNPVVSLSNVTLTAAAGSDFGFVDAAKVTLTPPTGSGLAEHTIVDYTRATAAPTVIQLVGDTVDLAPYLKTGTLTYAVSMQGSMPTADVVADVDACASATVKFNYAN
jgi:hypothetical protein